MTRQLNRRGFLGAAGLGLALPMLESLGRAAPSLSSLPGLTCAEPARRLVVIGPALGLHTPSLYPAASAEAGSQLPASTLLEPLGALQGELSLCAGLDHRGRHGHAFWRTFLTGPDEHSVSLDQRAAPVLGGQTRFSSLQLCGGPPGATEVMSVTPEGIALPMNYRPRALFGQLFGRGADQAHLAYLLESNTSVLDAVREDARRLNRRVSRTDSEKLDEYFSALRAVEKELAHEQSWLGTPKPEVDYEVGDVNPLASAQMFKSAQAMYDLMGLALQTDSARVMTLYFPKFSPVFTLDGRKLIAGYHALSHHNGDADMIRDLVAIDQVHMRMFADFLETLRSRTDAEGRSLLDSTLVMFGSGMGDASRHSNDDVPILLAGGGLRHGSFHDYRAQSWTQPTERPVLADLYVTLLRRMGVELEAFANSTGDLDSALV